MTYQYPIDQAQTRFTQILNEVEQGSLVELTRSGKRVVVLIASEEYDRLILENRPGFWQALQTFRQQANLAEAEISSETFEGLRENSSGREVSL
ncbi:MAG: type II toxin-antitoxin system prevent-host-death family antitoxin [Acaryochloris sp. RU_4_1]|nr:type II toxin-antitoxin system prevent-host-death family antitoxin [Leptolyngbyaceae cyanobacterium SU_3_3]NJM66674.1 type II toxin-antitoxin system prevent-host-death family antitoxin [Acaryochloris sp. RU_4_1]NJR56537.1 type II toxin-antitoxin system prevent-host-death family antitoxin [Acaryochloris sp. CRU_2_0]